jgi:serine/threonine protein kinase
LTNDLQLFSRKLIRPFAGITNDEVENEIRAVSKLCSRGHKNIISVLGHYWLKDSPYYAIDMELCAVSLAVFIRGERKLVEQNWAVSLKDYQDNASAEAKRWLGVCSIMLDILDGLSFIHGWKEVHRDLKPSNSKVPVTNDVNQVVLYSSSTNAWKIADFGFTSEGSSKRTVFSKNSRGTEGYRAPELVRDNSVYNQKVDIWAFGCIFYEIVAESKAFDDDWQVRQYWQSQEPLKIPPVNFHHSNSAQFLESILLKTLHKDLNARPSAQSLCLDYRAFRTQLQDLSILSNKEHDVDSTRTSPSMVCEPNAGIHRSSNPVTRRRSSPKLFITIWAN